MARAGAPKPRVGPSPKLRGAALPLWSGRADVVEWAKGRLDELVTLNATSVELVVLGRQRDATSVEVTRSPGAPSDADLTQIIQAASERGLTVLLLPILELTQVSDGDWRGTLRPADRERWWASYERFVLGYAELAQRAGVQWLGIGSELGSTEGWRDRWYHLISETRRRFAGKLFYSANWDHYTAVSFWPRLDAIGISSYFTLAKGDDDSTAAMAQRWRGAQIALARYADGLRLPLLLTEVGIPSRDGAARAPWDYTREGPVDLEEQRRAFAALAASFIGRPILGVLVWELASDGGIADTGYSPRGKPAWCALARWWRAASPCPSP